VLCLLLATVSPALFAANTGTITLTGSEPVILQITVTSAPAASVLALNTLVTNLVVGTVTELSNKRAGYTVTLGSANALAGASATPTLISPQTTDFLAYTIQYGGVAVVFPAGGAPAVVSSVSAKTSATGTVNSVTISFDGTSKFLNESAAYTDTLTFTIISK